MKSSNIPMATSVAGLITGILFFSTGSLHSPLMNSWRYGIVAIANGQTQRDELCTLAAWRKLMDIKNKSLNFAIHMP